MIAQHSSVTNEAYTPRIIVDPARQVLQVIDLDPASCTIANTVVGATQYYTDADDGLFKPWAGRLFVNPPGGKLDAKTFKPLPRNAEGKQGGPGVSQAAAWWTRLAWEYALGAVEAAVFVCFSMSIFRTAQDKRLRASTGYMGKMPFDFPFLIPAERINYDKVEIQTVADHGAQERHVRVATRGAPADTAIVYLPDRKNKDAGVQRFVDTFSHLGRIRL